jgi:hypothetical protein
LIFTDPNGNRTTLGPPPGPVLNKSPLWRGMARPSAGRHGGAPIFLRNVKIEVGGLNVKPSPPVYVRKLAQLSDKEIFFTIRRRSDEAPSPSTFKTSASMPRTKAAAAFLWSVESMRK